MLAKSKMQEIQDLKLRGFTKTEIAAYYEERGEKPPSRPTINKYYDMDVVPENPGARLAKDKSFDAEPFRSTIIAVLEANSHKNFCMSSVYDLLEEKFVENGGYGKLPGNEQTLRNYIHYLADSGQVSLEPGRRRIYDHVFDTPPGEQMLIDFGETSLPGNRSIHFICLLLRYSRLLCVYAQDHKYNSTEACQAIYRAFCRLGGRPRCLVIDQDAVFVASEVYGEVVRTRVFEDFCTEQELRLWVCNKADPESKGPIENSVGFVKKNFFSARRITCIDDVWRSLPGWLERKNGRIHRSTLRVPRDVFEETEKQSLRPLLPSVYERSPNTFRSYEVAAMPYVLYRSCRYSVPREYAYRTVLYKVVNGKIHIYDTDLNLICSHNLSERKGSFNQLPGHRKQESGDWAETAERLRARWNCHDFQHFINGVKKENPRHVSQQLGAIEQFLESENPDRSLVAQVMRECCEHFRYRFSQFRAVYSLAKAGRELSVPGSGREVPGGVEYKDMSAYAKAFQSRVKDTEAAG